MKLRRTPPPCKDNERQLWWVRDCHTHGRLEPVQIVVLRTELNFSTVAYQRLGWPGWTFADDQGVEWYGRVEVPEAADD